MRLTELEPHWMTEVTAGGWRRGAPDQRSAQGVAFLCPKCFAANGGRVGTHTVLVLFRDRGVPADAYPSIARWAATGNTFDDLTTTPSILIGGGCEWHGFITNGDVT